MEKIRYFGYGSNMLTARIRDRVPSAEPVGIAKLKGYSLRFHKKSVDGSGKGDAFNTGDPNDVVWGVVFEIDKNDKKTLDLMEGLGYGYDEKIVELEKEDGEEISALTYYATNIDETILPYNWYKKLVLYGAKEHGLPEDYIDDISKVKSEEDFNENRKKENESLLPE